MISASTKYDTEMLWLVSLSGLPRLVPSTAGTSMEGETPLDLFLSSLGVAGGPVGAGARRRTACIFNPPIVHEGDGLNTGASRCMWY